MNQSERRMSLIRVLLKEHPEYRGLRIPADADTQWQLLRGLLNIREPRRIGTDFLQIQDEYLQTETAAKGITDIADLTPLQPGLYLWQGDITTLKCDAIVNAANSGMSDRSGSTGGNRSHRPKNRDIDVVDTIDSRMNRLPRNRHASR